MNKEMAQGALKTLTTSFPDFTFNSTGSRVQEGPDGKSWFADITVTGTHTGPAFTPNPEWEAVPTSNKSFSIGPERFTLYVDGDKTVKMTVEPLKAGPFGPWHLRQHRWRHSAANIYRIVLLCMARNR